MNQYTPAQVKAIETWTATRDALLGEIGTLSTELEEKQKLTVTEGLNLADLHKSISEARGRLAELDAQEERARTSVSNDVAELMVRKARLESECAGMSEKLSDTAQQFLITTSATESLRQANDLIRDKAATVESVLGQIIDTSAAHALTTKETIAEIKAVSDTVIDRANENLDQTKIVLDKMPKFIFDMQKPIPVRRTYPVGHPRHESSVTPQ